MTKQMKRSSAWLLVLALALSTIMAACSSNNSKESSSSPAAQPDKSPQTSESAKPAPKQKISVSIYDRNNVPEGEGTITDNRWTKWIQENAPVDVEFIPVPRTNSAEKWNVLFASGEAPDLILEFSNAFMRDLADKGQIIPLDDVIANHSTVYKSFLADNPLIQKLTKHNDKTFFFGRVTPMSTNHYLMIRKDWLDNLGLGIPQTTEQFLEVAKAFTLKDPDGNNKNDTLGATFHDVDFFFQVLAIPADPINVYFLKDGSYTRSWERTKAVLEFKKAMYEAGVVDKDIFADEKGTKAEQDWLNGKLGIWGSDNLEGGKGYGSFETFRKNNPNAEVVILPMPESSFGKFAPAGGTPMQFTAAINATAKYPEAVMAYVDWLMSDEVAHTLRYGFEGEHYSIGENGCPVAIDADTNKKELSWNGDFQMLSNIGFMGKCAEFASTLDPSKPLDKEYLDLIAQGRAAYLTPDRPLWKQFEFSPPLPSDMLVVTNTIKSTLTNIYTQAIIGGPSATVDKAIDEAKKAWEQAGGKRIDDFYASEFDKNKDNIINTNEYFKYIQ